MVEMLLLLVATILHILDRGIYYAQLIVFHLLVCIRNAKKLWYMLIHGTKTWIYMLGRLILFTIVLAPGWYQFLKYFFFDSFILRNIEYGKGSKFRNVMDIYLPLPMDVLSQLRNDAKSYPDGAPVVIFVSGGAWIIGYKLWSALVGRALACFGVLTIVPDYRNFPQGDIADMTQDIKNAILWVEANCSRFGGNPNKIVLAGQSAGAHICLCLLVEEYLGMKIPKTEEEYYVEKLNMNYKVFDTIIDVKSPVKAVVTSSEKHAHHHNGSQHHAVQSPAKINKNDHPVSSKVVDRSVKDYIADDNNDDDDDVEESTSEDDEGEDADNVTPIHGLGEDDSYLSAESGFKDFPIFPMKERQNLERLILHQAMGSEGNDPHDPPDSLSSFENTSQWFDTPFEAKGNHTPSTHSYHSKGKSSNADELPIIQEQVNHVEEEDEELNESIWREVIDNNDSHAHTANEQQHSVEKTIPNNNNNNNSSQKKKRKNSPSSASSQYIHLQKKLQKLHARHHQHQTNILNKVKLFIGVSGPYNLQALESHLHKRGLDSSILHWICRGNLSESSPTVRLQQYVIQEFTKLTQNNANNNNNNSNNHQENSQIDQQPQPVTAYEVATVTDITTSSTAPNNGNNSNNNNNNSSISPANAMKSSWRIVNFIQSEINLYVSKLFQPINNSSLNSNDDVIVGQAFNYLQAHQHYLKEKTNLLSDFIPVALFHGSLDVSIPESISEELAEVLTDHGAQIVYKAYPDWNHTDAILEAPLYGNTKLFKDMIRIIRHVTDTHQSLDVLKGGVGNGNHITSLNRKRSLSFPSDLHAKIPSTMSIAYPVIDKVNNKDEEHGKTQKKGIKPNPSETPMAPRFLLDIGRKLNPF